MTSQTGKLMAGLALLSALCLTPAKAQSVPAAPKPTHLVSTTQPVLVDCAPVTPVPCMTMGITAVDDSDRPAAFPLPPAQKLTTALKVQSAAGNALQPFYATTGQGLDASQHTNVILLVIDISGSMNDPSPGATSRFNAIQGAVTRYIDAMDEGSDEIAIVPFESHNVVSTIRAAVFSSRKADLLAQLNAMPQPTPKNNTALYQAVFTGAETLKAEVATLEHDGHSAAELQPHLLVMTDGKNEVQAGDDPLLLNGPLGLTQATAQVTASKLDVIGVGFGDPAAIDAESLRKLSTRFFYAADANQLLDALHVTRTEKSHVIQMTWVLAEPNRVALTGRDQIWTPILTLDGGSILNGEPVRMIAPATAAPLYSRSALPAELVALIAAHPPTSSGWSFVVVHLLLFLSASALLLVLWFWVPRLIWGERYLSSAPKARWSGEVQPGQRASSERQSVTAASGVQIRDSSLPAGFRAGTEAPSPLQRSPAQTTQVGLNTESPRFKPRPD